MKLEQHIEIERSGLKAAELLADATTLSKQVIKQAMDKGCVWVTDRKNTRRLRRADKTLRPGDTLHLYYDEKILAQKPADAILVADEGEYSIWFKPCGMLSQGSKWGDHTTLNRYAEKHLQPQRPAFIVHRLDRATAGLMILAHSKTMANRLAALFRERQVEKRYRAIVHGIYDGPATIEQPVDDKPACSHVRLQDADKGTNTSLVEVTIETGRKHQVRRHLAGAGFPVVGDRLYGKAGNGKRPDLCLRSSLLAFISPADGSKKSYTLPDDLELALATTDTE